MTEQQKKKIAEIRKSAGEARKTDRSWVDGQDYADDVEFLLDELERLERELDMYKASSEVFYERLKKACEDREKLIDALQTISTDTECPYTSAFAKRKLKEIGVVVK
jgi:hypothetical protein